MSDPGGGGGGDHPRSDAASDYFETPVKSESFKSPERTKRLTGHNKSPHKSTGFSPSKKQAKCFSTPLATTTTPLPVDFDIPDNIVNLHGTIAQDKGRANLESCSPIRLDNRSTDVTQYNYTDPELMNDLEGVLDDINLSNNHTLHGLLADVGVKVELDPLNMWTTSKATVTNSHAHTAPAPAQIVHTGTQCNGQPVQTLRVPPSLYKFKTFKPVDGYCVAIPGGKPLRSANRHELTREEEVAVMGPSGFLQSLCPIFGTRTNTSTSKSVKQHEYVKTYYCKGRCKVQIDVRRVEGGLVAMQKCEVVNGTMVPIQHTHHDEFWQRGGSRGKAGPLSITQQIFIARHYNSDSGCPDTFIKSMIDNPNVPCSDSQCKNLDAFKTSVVDFHRNNGQFFHGSPKKKSMTALVILEILELLKEDPSTRDLEQPPIGKSGDMYYTTSAWKTLVWKHIHVWEHDYDSKSGKFTKILFAPADAELRARGAGITFVKRHVQLETDYFKIHGDESDWQVGHVGVSDYEHKYWPLAFQVAKSENKDAVVQLLENGICLVENACYIHDQLATGIENARVTKIMADGGVAIASGISSLNDRRQEGFDIDERRCFAHVIRMGFTRGGGIRGGKGSLARYLLDNRVPPKVMAKMMNDVRSDHVQLYSIW